MGITKPGGVTCQRPVANCSYGTFFLRQNLNVGQTMQVLCVTIHRCLVVGED